MFNADKPCRKNFFQVHPGIWCDSRSNGLVFDEADGLLSTRASTDESWATKINQSRNCLMQLLDRFNGVVIVRTKAYSRTTALLRRIPFRNPDASMRWELFALHLSNPDRVQVDDAVLSEI